MINQEKWINTLPESKIKLNHTENQIDNGKWVGTIPKKNNYTSLKKYSLILTFFVCGLVLISLVKNETRNLQKEIFDLRASINIITSNLKEVVLDNEVLTSPENISLLAKKHLSSDFVYYKNSQIKNLNEETKDISIKNKITEKIKIKVAKNIEERKKEIKKLKKLYNSPEQIPEEIRTQVAKQISTKKTELEAIYESPKEILTFQKIQKWGAVQVVKAFLGMPIIPGR